MAASVVKRSRVLDEAQAEADVPYESTLLAREAPRARARVAVLLAIGAGGFAVEALAQSSALWLIPALGVAASAWGVRRGGLGGIVAAGLVATLAVLIPLAFAALGVDDRATWISIVVSVVWGLAMLPAVVTLLRDAELQHAYGLWARRE